MSIGENEMISREMMLAAASAVAVSGAACAQFDTVAIDAGYPADARPGQCFARVLIPEVAQVVAEQVVDQAERTEIRIIPAEYTMVDEQVMIKEESVVYDVVPAQYTTVEERVLVQDEQIETIVIPASYETVEERVLVRPAYETWKPGAGLFGRSADSLNVREADGTIALPTGEILCKVEVPAEYRTLTRRQLLTPERTEQKVTPARFDTVAKRVVAQPPQVVERVVPAEFKTVKVRRMVAPPQEDRIVIPAIFKTIERTEVVSGGGVEWREVLCDTNATPEKIAEIQRALAAEGFDSGRADGVFGQSTLAAMERFQLSRGLIVGQLTRETVEALGVEFQGIIRS
jgi:hypothetical protein